MLSTQGGHRHQQQYLKMHLQLSVKVDLADSLHLSTDCCQIKALAGRPDPKYTLA